MQICKILTLIINYFRIFEIQIFNKFQNKISKKLYKLKNIFKNYV